MGLSRLLRDEWEWFLAARGKAAYLDRELCTGCCMCYEVCPVGCFRPGQVTKAVDLSNVELCVACGACVLQCPEGALQLAAFGRGG
jgi:NAD-dependent dihydropyrimidine dehydrogenase PreA subunit